MKRNNLKLLIIAGLVILAIVYGCRESTREFNPAEEKKIIEEVIHSSIGWAKNKDLKLLYSIIANDTNYLEVHPGNSVVKGFENFKKQESFWMNPDFKPIRYEMRDMRINLSNSGDAAWWFCILDDINEWKGKPSSWENTRVTGVLEKRNGRWVIVQMHFSFASK